MNKILIETAKILEANVIDAMLITNKANIFYMTGFRGSFGFLVATHKKFFLITDSRYTQQARNDLKRLGDNAEVIEIEQSYLKELDLCLKQNNIKRLGFEDKHVTYHQYHTMNQHVGVELVAMETQVETLRVQKDEAQIHKIEKAVAIADKAFEHIINFIKPGMSEKDIALEINYYMLQSGAEQLAFETIVASGEQAALPHAVPSNKKVSVGELIVMDFGCVVDGYCSDMTRTIGLGSVDKKQREVYGAVLDAQQSAMESVRSFVAARAVHMSAVDTLKKYSLDKYFRHGTGHGVGIDVHEAPRVSDTSDDVLKDSMCITIEPGVYINGLLGVRIEDLIVVDGNGIKILTASPKELIVL